MMFRLLLIAATLIALLLVPAPCYGQFFDDFDGNALAPHWEDWGISDSLEYHVAGGMLHVTDILLPSNPDFTTNSGGFRAAFPPVSGDFSARALVGWVPGTLRVLRWSLGSVDGHLVSAMQYSELGPGAPSISVQGGVTQPIVFPGPLPGSHEFLVTRQGATVSAFLDGEFLTSFSGTTSPVGYTFLEFRIAYPNPGMETMYLDLVEVIPSPAASAVLALGGLASITQRRRRR